jgi:hypothetical protein
MFGNQPALANYLVHYMLPSFVLGAIFRTLKTKNKIGILFFPIVQIEKKLQKFAKLLKPKK